MKKIDILQANFVQEMMETTANLYRLGGMSATAAILLTY